MEKTTQQGQAITSLQSFKNAIRNLDVSGILENNCDCYYFVVTFADPNFMILRFLGF